jgi:ABC-type antimicrobial peptide transport system permease subunit
MSFALFPRTLRTALNALKRNKMRSALTTLGVIIGVCAVIAMVEIGQGSKAQLQKTIASMGANTLMVGSGAATKGGFSHGSESVITLTPQDADEIARQCPAVTDVAPLVGTWGQVIYGNRNCQPMQMFGTTPSYLIVRDWENLSEGEMFTDRDVRAASNVCVVGETIKRDLFQNESPVGKEIRVQNVSLRVLGVLSKKGANMVGMDQDDLVLAPWTTIKYRVNGTTSTKAIAAAADSSNKINSLDDIYPGTEAVYTAATAAQLANNPQPVRFTNITRMMVKASSTEEVPVAIKQITALLRERHHLHEGEEDDFNIRDMAEFTRMLSSTSQTMGMLLLIVALISLVVGGVGIMNIMLVSVTERTREIGLRMAVGARSHHILRQFLIEAIVLCLLGGALGILLGRLISIMVRTYVGWVTQASILAIVGAVVVSASVGIIFGFYPAWKASRLDPIEALRYE